MNVTAVAYARFSSDHQQQSSITVQLEEIRRFCEKNGICLLREYVDEAQSGTNVNRRSFQRMISDAADSHEFRMIVVHRFDRFARNVDDALFYRRILRQQGIHVVSVTETFDETPEGDFYQLMSMGMAELYSKTLAREAENGKRANASQGRTVGGPPPLGYQVRRHRYDIEENDAEIVRIIFRLTVQGKTYREIIAYLIRNGYRRSDGRDLRKLFLHDILTNRKYAGDFIYSRCASKDERGKRNTHRNKPEEKTVILPGGIPAIVDRETFEKVQKIIERRKRKT